MSNVNSSETSGHNKSYGIIVNGKQRTVTENTISYEQVVRLAFPEGPFDILFTVAYASPHGKDGTLAPGQDTHVKEGMSFNVIKTNRS
jgi:hypothetical protein